MLKAKTKNRLNRWVALEEQRKQLEVALADVKKKQEIVEEAIRAEMVSGDEDDTGDVAAIRTVIQGRTYEVKHGYKTLPRITDRGALERYAIIHDCLDIFQSRVNSKVWGELCKENGTVDGVEVFKKPVLSIKPVKE